MMTVHAAIGRFDEAATHNPDLTSASRLVVSDTLIEAASGWIKHVTVVPAEKGEDGAFAVLRIG